MINVNSHHCGSNKNVLTFALTADTGMQTDSIVHITSLSSVPSLALWGEPWTSDKNLKDIRVCMCVCRSVGGVSRAPVQVLLWAPLDEIAFGFLLG